MYTFSLHFPSKTRRSTTQGAAVGAGGSKEAGIDDNGDGSGAIGQKNQYPPEI